MQPQNAFQLIEPTSTQKISNPNNQTYSHMLIWPIRNPDSTEEAHVIQNVI